MTEAHTEYKKCVSSQPSSFEVARMVTEASHSAKGQDVTVLDVREVFDMADYFIIVSGRSDRQSQGICNKIIDRLGKEGVKPIMVEGFDDGHWILLDFGDVVAHIFYEATREHYDLEGLWINAKKLSVVERGDRTELKEAA